MIRFPLVLLRSLQFASVRLLTGRRSLVGKESLLIAAAVLAVLFTAACDANDEPSTSTSGPVKSDAVDTTPRAGQATSSTSPLDGLEATIDVDGQSVQGRFNRLRFEARLTGEGEATASFERVAGMTLVSTVSGPHQGRVEWRGTILDGFGELTLEEAESAAHFADRIKADVLALIPLDLACQEGAEQLDPAIGAALLLPWQILLKYQPEGEIPTSTEVAANSRCHHLHRPLDGLEQPRAASPSIVYLSGERPFPMATGYLPLDSKGFVSPDAQDQTDDG